MSSFQNDLHKFKEGDTVILFGLKEIPDGIEAQVVSYGYIHKTEDIIVYNVIFDESAKVWAITPANMKLKEYDGYRLSNWEAGVWKPKLLKGQKQDRASG